MRTIAQLSFAFVLIVACGQGQQEGVARTRTYRNVTGAMEPTIRMGQSVTVTLFDDSSSAIRAVQRGDLVLYAWPPDTSKHFIKRVIGLTGDTLAMRGGELQRNGQMVVEPYAVRDDTVRVEPLPELEWTKPFMVNDTSSRPPLTRRDWGPLVVPPGAFFVLGDSRDHSLDSRYWGFLNAAQILGRLDPAAPGAR